MEKLDYRTNEAYKTLRSNIEFCGAENKAIAVTSCTPGEGKSSVAFNMAVSMADAGHRVILIDADLRKSVLVGRYKTETVRRGLTHYLAGQSTFEEVVASTNIKNLYVAFAGPVPPNPSELLGGKGFHALMDGLRKIYEYIIVDTPPLGSVIDSAVVAKECDGAVLVIESGAISYRFAQRVQEQLSKANCKPLGVVLNKVNVNSKGYYGYYGKYYGKNYGNYGNYGNEG